MTGREELLLKNVKWVLLKDFGDLQYCSLTRRRTYLCCLFKAMFFWIKRDDENLKSTRKQPNERSRDDALGHFSVLIKQWRETTSSHHHSKNPNIIVVPLSCWVMIYKFEFQNFFVPIIFVALFLPLLPIPFSGFYFNNKFKIYINRPFKRITTVPLFPCKKLQEINGGRISGVLAVFWQCSGSVLTVFWQCSDSVLTVFWQLETMWMAKNGTRPTLWIGWQNVGIVAAIRYRAVRYSYSTALGTVQVACSMMLFMMWLCFLDLLPYHTANQVYWYCEEHP